MTVTGRKHNTDDVIATVLAVEPMKFIYRGRIAVFAIRVLRDERICVVAEQRPDCSEEESFQWMSRVLQAVDSIHQVGDRVFHIFSIFLGKFGKLLSKKEIVVVIFSTNLLRPNCRA